MSLTPEQLKAFAEFGIKKGMEVVHKELGGKLPEFASTAITDAITVGVEAAIEAVRLAEIKIEHDGDVTGTLEL